MMNYKEINLENLDQDELINLFGVDNNNIRIIEALLNCDLIARGSELKVDEDHYDLFKKLIESLIDLINNKQVIDKTSIEHAYKSIIENNDTSWQKQVAIITSSGKPIKYKRYWIEEN